MLGFRIRWTTSVLLKLSWWGVNSPKHVSWARSRSGCWSSSGVRHRWRYQLPVRRANLPVQGEHVTRQERINSVRSKSISLNHRNIYVNPSNPGRRGKGSIFSSRLSSLISIWITHRYVQSIESINLDQSYQCSDMRLQLWSAALLAVFVQTPLGQCQRRRKPLPGLVLALDMRYSPRARANVLCILCLRYLNALSICVFGEVDLAL